MGSALLAYVMVYAYSLSYCMAPMEMQIIP